ncbi:hypothetical protein AAG570_010024 [Ranatra chinensis]|uniref:PTHB1 hairpin domain-containing protein n=1 Tax=Ranatra chinensis TaxID=642074 RepID=A0ABD0YLP8_9HEMI
MWDSNGCSETLAGFRFRAAPDFGFTVALSRQYSKYRLETDNVVALALPTELKEATSQYRAGQRRLLSKLRDKIATEVDQLEKLMSWTYDLIMEYTHQIEQAQEVNVYFYLKLTIIHSHTLLLSRVMLMLLFLL